MLRVDERPGTGAPIVLLHGVLDDSSVWERVALDLAASGRHVALVHARADPADWSPQADARDVAELIRDRWPSGAHLVGHSRGATSASWIAVDEPDLARSLVVVASPPVASEVFRAAFRKQLARATDERARRALAYLSQIPDDDFPQHALRRYRGPALVVEAEDDPLYAPTHTMFWRLFLPYADFERVPGGHRFFADDAERARWLAERVLRHVRAAEA